MTIKSLIKHLYLPVTVLALIGISYSLSAEPTGDCTSGTQYCEDNGLNY